MTAAIVDYAFNMCF